MLKYYTARYEQIFMYSVVKSDILKKLIEFIIEKEIIELKILNPNLIQDTYKTREQRLDLLIKTKDDIINVEINSNYNEEIKIRNLNYLFKTASENTEKGNKYKITHKIIQINLNFKNGEYKKCEYLLYDKKHEIVLTDYIKIYNISVDKYKKNYYNNDKKFTKGEELIIMLDLNKKDLEELSEKSESVKEYKENVDKANNDEFIVNWISREEEQKQYEEVLYEKGLMEKSIEITKKMLELNMDLETISKITGLTIEKIESLRN